MSVMILESNAMGGIAMSTPVPHVQYEERVVLFDAVCVLCHGWTKFLLRYDTQQRFKLCSVQSEQGQAILAHFGYPTDQFDTMLYVEAGQAYQKTDAFLRIMAQLPRPWCWLRVMRLFPARARDWLYDRIARNRYRIFGQYQQCALPSSEHRARFLEHV